MPPGNPDDAVEATDADTKEDLVNLLRYKTHLDRMLERMLATLLKVRIFGSGFLSSAVSNPQRVNCLGIC